MSGEIEEKRRPHTSLEILPRV